MITPVSLLQRLRLLEESRAAAVWGEFVELYTPLLYSWARRLGLQTADASDLVQDVFVILVRKLPEFHYDSRKSFHAWLRTVFMNRWRDLCRRPAAASPQAAEAEMARLPGPDDAADREETEHRESLVRRALEIMRREFQPSTWMACWEQVVYGRPAAEVAAELGMSVHATYLALARPAAGPGIPGRIARLGDVQPTVRSCSGWFSRKGAMRRLGA